MFKIQGTEHEPQEPGTILDVELRRLDGEGFGFNIIGGTDSNEIFYHSGIFISQINPNGPAERSGCLDVGDQLLEVNGFSLATVKHWEAVEAFRKAGSTANIKVEKFGQQLILAKRSTDAVDAPPPGHNSRTTRQLLQNFLNSWAGAMVIGTAAGIMAMFAFTKLTKSK